MKTISTLCPSCNAPVEFTSKQKKTKCPYCSVDVYLQSEMESMVNLEKLLEDAEQFVDFGEKDKARNLYTRITDEHPRDYRGHWGLLELQTDSFKDLNATGYEQFFDRAYRVAKKNCKSNEFDFLKERYDDYHHKAKKHLEELEKERREQEERRRAETNAKAERERIAREQEQERKRQAAAALAARQQQEWMLKESIRNDILKKEKILYLICIAITIVYILGPTIFFHTQYEKGLAGGDILGKYASYILIPGTIYYVLLCIIGALSKISALKYLKFYKAIFLGSCTWAIYDFFLFGGGFFTFIGCAFLMLLAILIPGVIAEETVIKHEKKNPNENNLEMNVEKKFTKRKKDFN